MDSAIVKQFLSVKLGIKARVRTIPCKSKWIDASIPGKTDPTGRTLVFSQSFPEAFRRICMKVVYPNSPVGNQAAGGNIGSVSISMLPAEWNEAIRAFSQLGTAA